ncbi:hypothetical protein PAECIP111891_06740 [Paenibacillus allorhizoplanae]|uniref:Uncharacterized protein n=1 Tax=Paenibacillus allorhizoplanae TaxID=2905648 RepID=A0ABN8HA88_9BACL|nr:hypothetical protein PAECIP111891_06740 [Paenibacillus allorhizoplanae]
MTRNTPFGGPITSQRQAFKFMLKKNDALHRRGLLKLHMDQKRKRLIRSQMEANSDVIIRSH